MWSVFWGLGTDQIEYLSCGKTSADCVNTDADPSRRTGGREKQKATVLLSQQEKESEAWISQLSAALYHPPTDCPTHSVSISTSLTQTHSIPIPAAGHTSAQDYQISSWRFGFPDGGLCVVESELGHLDGAALWSTQECFVTVAHENSLAVCSAMPPCYHSQVFLSFLPCQFSLPVPITDLLILHSNIHSHTLPHPISLWYITAGMEVVSLQLADRLRIPEQQMWWATAAWGQARRSFSHALTCVLLYSCEDFLLK